MSSFAFTTTKWALGLATKLIKADVRTHNIGVIEKDMAIVFVVNHFTRLETLLLPYEINKHTGLEVWSMAAAELFVGRIGEFLRSMGTVSTKDPDRDKMVTHSLLKGDHPWIIFPEGLMVKDKKVIDPAGTFSVFTRDQRRPPHKGAAVLALHAEFYRRKLRCVIDRGDAEEVARLKERFALENPEEALAKRTVIIPVNITYFPIRARENAVLNIARSLMKTEMSERAVEELSLEGTFLSKGTDLDITLGDPIDVGEYLEAPEFAELMACGLDHDELDVDLKPLFSAPAEEMMIRYMRKIYEMTRVNYDHIFATIIRHQGHQPFTERAYRNRIYLIVHELRKLGRFRLHKLLEETYRDVLYEDPSPKFRDFMELCIKEKIIRRYGEDYVRLPGSKRMNPDFQTVRSMETTHVIANEVEPLDGFVDMVKKTLDMPREDMSKRIRKIFFEKDYDLFEKDYTEYRADDSHHMDVGRPFLMVPDNYRAGVVLVHGYMAAPLEVRALAEYLFAQGYAVYGVRLKGHGTAPEDLARTKWEEWYESLNRGYVIIKTLTDHIILGGFSTGGCLALMGAAMKREKVQAVFSINAPLKLQSYAAKFAPTITSMNSLLKVFHAGKQEWDFVTNNPENAHINYRRNPLRGVAELNKAMVATEAQLANILVPSLVIQASHDHVVHPDSGPQIFEKIGTPLKELTIFQRDRHGIINGAGSEDVFYRVKQFLEWAETKHVEVPVPAYAAEAEIEAGKPALKDATETA